MGNIRIYFILPFLVTAVAVPSFAQSTIERAMVLDAARMAYSDICNNLPSSYSGLHEEAIARFEVSLQDQRFGTTEETVVWQFFCDRGTYSVATFFWLQDDTGGLLPLAFVEPVVEVVREVPDDFQSPVTEVRLTGWTATTVLNDATFDPATLTFDNFAEYRNFGDAFERGTWRLEVTGPVIQSYEVDGSFDDEQNPVSIYPAP